MLLVFPCIDLNHGIRHHLQTGLQLYIYTYPPPCKDVFDVSGQSDTYIPYVFSYCVGLSYNHIAIEVSVFIYAGIYRVGQHLRGFLEDFFGVLLVWGSFPNITVSYITILCRHCNEVVLLLLVFWVI